MGFSISDAYKEAKKKDAAANNEKSNKKAVESNVNYSGSFISGFYYDLQKENRLLSVTLHPNMVTSDGGVTWVKPSGEVDEDGYRKEPIARAILKEDFVVGVANNWMDFSGGDTINQIWNSLKPFAPYAKYAAEHLEEMARVGNEEKAKGGFTGVVANLLNDMVNKFAPYVDKAADYLNRSLVVQGTRFSYYAGTGTSFGNLQMKYIIFGDWINGQFKTVHDQLQELYPYILGKYVNWDTKNKDNMLNQFVGWQLPPGGFKADVKNVDIVQEGTLKLKFGGYYSIPNIVVKDAQLTFSKQMIKSPRSTEGSNKISPLYCDIQLTLQPATKYTDISLRNFVEGKGTVSDIQEIEGTLSDNLSNIKDQNAMLLGNYQSNVSSDSGSAVSELASSITGL